jgi:hypothetical protein
MAGQTKPAYKEANEMLSTRIRTTIAALTALTTLAVPASALAESSPTEWRYNRAPCSSTFECSPAQPLPGQLYDLNDQYEFFNLQHKRRTSLVFGFTPCASSSAVPGVELQWASPGRLQWEFRRKTPHPMTTAITGTEQVALYNHVHHAYLVLEGPKFSQASNQPQTVGLVFSATPSYEWQVADGQGDWAELYNTQAQAYLSGAPHLVRGPSSYCGIDLWWRQAPFSLPSGYQPPQTPWESIRPSGPPQAKGL